MSQFFTAKFFFSFQGAKQVYLPTWFKDNRCFPVQLEEVDKLWDSEWKRCLYNYPHNSQSLSLSQQNTHTLSLFLKNFLITFSLSFSLSISLNLTDITTIFPALLCFLKNMHVIFHEKNEPNSFQRERKREIKRERERERER